jgi:hypothetical protein
MDKITVAIFNIKGGTGKTSLSLALAYTLSDHLGHNVVYQTNDAFGPGEMERMGSAPEYQITIQDFGGFVPSGSKSDLAKLINQADCLLVPIRYERLSLRAGKDIIRQRDRDRRDPIVIGTECSAGSIAILREALGFETYRFRSSTAVTSMLNEQRSPYEIADENRLKGHSWGKNIEKYRHLKEEVERVVWKGWFKEMIDLAETVLKPYKRAKLIDLGKKIDQPTEQ